ncbi:MAG: hypothetical protein Roseis3KO_01750 [Roseivirga sp.]
MNMQGRLKDYHIFPGLDSTFQFTTNAQGYRSNRLLGPQKLGLLAIGASTTECVFLGDDFGWTHLLERSLNETFAQKEIVVANVGVSGLSSGHHYLQMDHLTTQYEHINTVLLLAGINDFLRFLKSDQQYLPSQKDPWLLRRAFFKYPRQLNPKWYQRTEIWMHMRTVKNDWTNRQMNERNDKVKGLVERKTKDYKLAEKADSLPDYQLAINDFEQNLIRMARLAKSRNLELVMMTQPVLWHEGISEREIDLSIMGVPLINGQSFTIEALARGMDQFNEVTRKVARDYKLVLIDLAANLPQDSTAFYDYCHFNKSGARLVAQLVSEQLRPSIENQLTR